MLCDKAWLELAIPSVRISGLPNDQKQLITLSIDSRSIEPGQFFIALPGTQSDGHNFIEQAIKNGAAGIIANQVSLKKLSLNIPDEIIVLAVLDTMQALINLAKAWRNTLTIPIVGITGSVGKTSTKGMLESILKAATINAYVSYQNQNTIIGVSLNLLKVTHKHTCAVFELGINDKGEMAELVDILRPTLGLITTITHAHASRIGSLEDIAREKRTIFKFFSASQVGIICGDHPLLNNLSYAHPIARFGTKTFNHVQARKIAIIEKEHNELATTFVLKWYNKKATITLPTHHQGMINNALAAATLAYHLNVTLEDVIRGLENYQGIAQRFEMKKMHKTSGMLINDCYNANPESMKAALIAFDRIKAPGEKIAILGNMLELGDRAVYWHRRIGRLLRNLKSINSLILVGDLAQHMAYSIPAHMEVSTALDWQEACKQLDEKISHKKEPLILVKASLGMALGKLVETFS